MSSYSHPSPQLIQVDSRLQPLGRLHYLVPSNLVILVGRSARENTRNCRLGALGGLVVKTAAGDAIHKRLLFFAVREFKIGSEIPRDREGLRLLFVFRRRHGGLPRLVVPDAQ